MKLPLGREQSGSIRLSRLTRAVIFRSLTIKRDEFSMLCKIHIDDWETAVSVLKIINMKNLVWVFRGQSNSDWDLKTKFEREGEQNDLDPYFYGACESNVITEFKRRAGQYIQNLPAPNDIHDWLSIIQHYGGPTRLLDFTYSFYIATFFAVQHTHSNSAVWALNINYLLKEDNEFKGQIGKISYQDMIKQYGEKLNSSIHFKPSNQAEESVCIVEPFIQEQRLSIQQGLFLAPTNIEKSFQNNLAKTINKDSDDFFDKNLTEITKDKLTKLKGEDILLLKVILSKHIKYEVIDQSAILGEGLKFPEKCQFTKIQSDVS
jgi:hypothetical protein